MTKALFVSDKHILTSLVQRTNIAYLTKENFCHCSAGDGVTFPTRTVDLDSDGLLADRQRWMEEGELDSHLNNGTKNSRLSV